MKRQLIYHTHVNTKPSDKIMVCVETDFTNTNCYLERICRDGITLSCDAETLHKIMPNKASVAPKDPIALTTHFTLFENIEAKCRVIFARRLAKNKFILELKFIAMNENTMQGVDNYIEENLKSNIKNKHDDQKQIQNKPYVLKSDVYQINKKIIHNYSKVA